MRNYLTSVEQAGIGRTPELCQEALMEMLQELFKDRKFEGQTGRKPLRIYKQTLPSATENDEDVDTNNAPSPYIIVRMTAGAVANDNDPQTIDMQLEICTYDDSGKHKGYEEVVNIKETIIQAVCTRPYFGGCFTILKPIAWALQTEIDETMPYYYAGVLLTCTAPAMTQDSALADLL